MNWQVFRYDFVGLSDSYSSISSCTSLLSLWAEQNQLTHIVISAKKCVKENIDVKPGCKELAND